MRAHHRHAAASETFVSVTAHSEGHATQPNSFCAHADDCSVSPSPIALPCSDNSPSHQCPSYTPKYPTTDEILLPDGGRRQEFQGGAIDVAIQNAIGSAIQNGPIRDKWYTVGGGTPGGSLLGYITGDEIPLPDGQGRMARFENGVVYWHPTCGAWIVRGGILHHWQRHVVDEPTRDCGHSSNQTD